MSDQLVQRWLNNNDEQSAEALYHAHHKRVYRLSYALLGDADAEVRLAAMTLLATTSDPAVRDRVRRLAAADHDRRIVALSERLAMMR